MWLQVYYESKQRERDGLDKQKVSKIGGEKEMKTVLHARISVTEYTSCVSNEGNVSIENQHYDVEQLKLLI